jgi:Protein of unknown function (DUF3147)
MTVSADLLALRGTQWHQYVVRFFLGGVVTAVTGLLGQHFGPVFGGLFLAFPALFPAGATLIAKRERQKKTRQGLHGDVRGRRAAALDAAGAVLGAVGLVFFALLVWKELVGNPAPLVLGAALLAWAVVSLTLWWLRKKHPWRTPSRVWE